MGRLIDVDLLIEKLKSCTCTDKHDERIIKKFVIHIVKQQPTVFDIEAVVKELEELKLNEILDNCPMKRTCANCEYSCSNCKGCYTGRALEIVRKGGVNHG